MKSYFKKCFLFLFFSFCLFTIVSTAYSQTELLGLFERNEIVRIENNWQNESVDGDKFIQSIFNKNALPAIGLMKNMIEADQDNPYLPALMERIGQYQFSVGLYIKARKTFSYLAENYKYRRFGETGLYYVARCWQAIVEEDSSRAVLEQFLYLYPRSIYSDVVSRELEDGNSLVSNSKKKLQPESQLSTNNSVFTIQTGAFSTEPNARLQQQFLEEKGYRAIIYPKWVKKKKYYVVCTGRFKAKKQAETSGRRISQKYHLDYQIIDLNQIKFVR